MENANYADYVPDRISPKLLSREFLLCVRICLYNFIAYCIFGPEVI